MRSPNRTPRSSPSPQAGAGAPLILIVEDDRDQRDMYAAYLRSQGFQVVTADDGEQAIRRAYELRPRVIVLDLSLPLMDGWEVARRLKWDTRTARIPIIACTAHILPSAREEALVAGCDAYVTKPCLPEHLLAAIKRFLPTNAATHRRAG